MIQILALRETRPGKKAEVWFEKGLRVSSLESLFADPDQILNKIPASERWNVYYTVAECLEEPGRKLDIQHHIPFDVDGLADEQTPEQLQMVARVVCDAIGVEFEKCGVIFSGHGVQVIVGTNEPITSVEDFDKERRYYKAICDRIDLRLIQAKIQGKADRSVWSPARLMRFPRTENRKPDKKPVMGIMLNATIERTDFTLRKASGLPEVDVRDQIATSISDSLATPDTKTIMDAEKGCKFLHWCQTHPDKVSEPEWYAMMSITARFPEGRKYTHKLSEGHPGYSFEETEQKITQSLESSGPRTCKNIDAISGKCTGCKFKGTKLVSPIMIEGPDHIKTEKSGFRHVTFDPETGVTSRKKVDYQGLAKYFYRSRPYVTIMGSATVWEYDDGFFKEVSRHELEVFARNHVDPFPTESDRKEFVAEVKLTRTVTPDFFTTKVAGMMNFANGVYNIQDNKLYPHSMEFGFRSKLSCDYDEKAECPRFLQFMDEVTCSRPELENIIQEYLGYIFANESCRFEKALLLIGDGSNGKSTLMHVLRALAGKYGSSSVSVKDMADPQNRLMLEGKLVNIAEENSTSAFRDTELLKNFVSGGNISVKRLYEQPYDYENQTKLVMLCNRMPDTSDASHGLLRKLLIIPFDATFSGDKKNIYLREELLNELPGIFNWIIKGYRRLMDQGRFSHSQVVDAVTDSYRLDIDPINRFLREECHIDESYEVNRTDLYTAYSQWCDINGLRAGSSIKFLKEARIMISKIVKTGDLEYRTKLPDGTRPRMLRGIKTDWKDSF